GGENDSADRIPRLWAESAGRFLGAGAGAHLDGDPAQPFLLAVVNDGRILRVGAGEFGAAQAHPERLGRMTDTVFRRRALEAAVRHAIVTLGVAPDAVAVPVGVLHQLAEGFGVAFVHK